MHRVLFVLAILAALALPAHARDPKSARLSADVLCGQLTLPEVTAILGPDFERRPDQLFLECKYGDGKDKQRVRYFSLGSSIVDEAGWRKMVEAGGKGTVAARDGVLVSRSRKNTFGALDEVWFVDRQGHRLYLRANAKISEDQAVALAKAAMD